MYLDYVHQKLGNAARRTVDADSRRFAQLTAKLDAMSPLKVLTRGYAVAEKEDGQILRSVNQAVPGERITVSLSDGSITAKVLEVKENGNESGK